MNLFPAQRRRRIFFALFLFILVAFFHFGVFPNAIAHADATPTPTIPSSSTATWAFDAEVTEVGKNADRARQLLWWVFSHPGIYSAPVLVQVWSFSRNLVYVFVILVIVALGLGLILFRREGGGRIFSGISSPIAGTSLTSILFKLVSILLYVTFSYVLILALVQISEISMRFFIENVGGRDLFNVIFAGAGNRDENYMTFIGYRDINPLNQEMANTSLFLIKLTSLTYFVIALLIVLRTIILWFLLIISPFLALLMPFVFIRNIGWIWIGVFSQWLFYGPLLALFLATVTKIWVSGIPFPFDFSRINQPAGQVYRTAINILYGGPAQTLSAGNSANYVDTYAEYVIALVMLWAAIILPWLLLRIFRDYCCELLAQSNVTLSSIFDRLRQYPPSPPPQPAGPTTTAGMAVELPFRSRIEEKIREVQKTKIEDIREISRTNTSEIVKAMDLSVSSLADVSRIELDQIRQSEVRQRLDKLTTPERISTLREREGYMRLKGELQSRALAGDRMAQTLLAASEKSPETLAAHATMIIAGRSQIVAPRQKRGVYAPPAAGVVGVTPFTATPTLMAAIPNLARQVNMSDSKVKEIVEHLSATGILSSQTINNVVQKTGVSEVKVKEIISLSQSFREAVVPTATKIAQKVGLTESKVREVIDNLPLAGVTPQNISNVAAKTGVSESKVQEIAAACQVSPLPPQVPVSLEDYEEVKAMWLNHFRSAPVPVSETIKDRQTWLSQEEKKLTNISNLLVSSDPKLKQKGLEEVAEILPFLLLGDFSEAELQTYVKAKLEADKQVQSEMEMQTKAKDEAKKQMVEEETLIEVSAKMEKGKLDEAVQVKSIDLPGEKEKENPSNQ